MYVEGKLPCCLTYCSTTLRTPSPAIILKTTGEKSSFPSFPSSQLPAPSFPSSFPTRDRAPPSAGLRYLDSCSGALLCMGRPADRGVPLDGINDTIWPVFIRSGLCSEGASHAAGATAEPGRDTGRAGAPESRAQHHDRPSHAGMRLWQC